MKYCKIIIQIVTILSLLLTFCSCSSTKIDRELEICVATLNGTTGFGMAKLMNDEKLGASTLNYSFSVESDPSNITAALINGDLDIAALPTNAAAALYNKSQGKVKIAAINTLGVLYLITNNSVGEVESISDLVGKKVYTPAQNPAFIFEAICRANGLTPNEDIIIDTSYAQPADLRSAVVSGQVDIAVLPEPMVTIAMTASALSSDSSRHLINSIDLTAEWEKIYGENTLAQGCIVVRTEWAEKHPKELEEFLSSYESSISFTNDNPKEASEMIESLGIFAGKALIAEMAIPKCNIKYIDGKEMASALDKFFSKLYDIAPQSIGGKIPDSNIYIDYD